MDFCEIARGIYTPSSEHTNSKATKERRVILVEGAPGVGKSTFAREFCRRWEKGEIAQRYQLMLLLRLRDDRVAKAKSLKDLIYHPLESVAQAVSEELALSHDFHALIILEGFDELPIHCQKDPILQNSPPVTNSCSTSSARTENSPSFRTLTRVAQFTGRLPLPSSHSFIISVQQASGSDG